MLQHTRRDLSRQQVFAPHKSIVCFFVNCEYLLHVPILATSAV